MSEQRYSPEFEDQAVRQVDVEKPEPTLSWLGAGDRGTGGGAVPGSDGARGPEAGRSRRRPTQLGPASLV
jgi:hypothetical protein